MKIVFFIIGVLFLSGCGFEPITETFKDYSISPIFKYDKPITTTNTTITNNTIQVDSDDYLIGSFNIQIFGKKKSESNVMPIIEEIIDDYDILAIQEVRDISGTAIQKLKNIRGYDVVASPRLGRSSSKEQYIFFYSSRVVPGKYKTFPDTNDVFEREPFAMEFTVDSQDIVIIQVHIKPDDAEQEIRHLVDVVEWAKTYMDNEDIYIMGDLNAGGVYFDSFGFLEENWEVLIKEDIDTTVYTDGCCAYDRILATKVDSKILEVGVDRLTEETKGDLELQKALSDHYPIYFIFE